MIVLDTIEGVMRNFDGVHTICGLSNVSTGLPLRRRLNHVFLALVMAKGLDSVIMDPCDQGLMSILITADTLLDRDEYCLHYIEAYRQAKLA